MSCNTNSNSINKVPLDYPTHFPNPIPSPERNELTAHGVALGKTLFFDASLSANGQISCASCHRPELAFSDNKRFSIGHSGDSLKRNTPPLFNLAWSESFFWDGGVKNLESLSFAALMSPDEMGTDLTELCETLNHYKSYSIAFQKAFKTDSISAAHVSRALAQYMRMLISADSKYDSVQQGLDEFSELEQKGRVVFRNNCASCHRPPLYTDNKFHKNGITQVYSTKNLSLTTGRFRITRDSTDLGKYKTPSLRNLSFTAPYMHDGRFSTLDEVLNHYQHIDQSNQNHDSLVRAIVFSNSEKLALRAFLNTLEGSAIY